MIVNDKIIIISNYHSSLQEWIRLEPHGCRWQIYMPFLRYGSLREIHVIVILTEHFQWSFMH